MPIPILAGLLSVLVGKGLDIVADKMADATETGVQKIGEFVEEKTGINILNKETVENLSEEDVSKVREATLKYRVELQAIALEHTKAVLKDKQHERELIHADTSDARAMAVAAGSDYHDKVFWLACFLLFSGIAYIFLITFVPIPEDNVRFADTALGFMLATVIASIIGYYYGNSFSGRSTGTSAVAPTSSVTKELAETASDALMGAASKKLKSLIPGK